MANTRQRIKVILVGDPGVGKTQLIRHFVGKPFVDDAVPSKTVEFDVIPIEMAGENIDLQLWDMPGNSDYDSLYSAYCTKADVAIIAVDVRDNNFEERIQYWKRWVVEQKGIADGSEKADDITFVLLATKTDLIKDHVNDSRVTQFVSLNNEKYKYRTSAKTDPFNSFLPDHVVQWVTGSAVSADAEQPHQPVPAMATPVTAATQPSPSPVINSQLSEVGMLSRFLGYLKAKLKQYNLRDRFVRNNHDDNEPVSLMPQKPTFKAALDIADWYRRRSFWYRRAGYAALGVFLTGISITAWLALSGIVSLPGVIATGIFSLASLMGSTLLFRKARNAAVSSHLDLSFDEDDIVKVDSTAANVESVNNDQLYQKKVCVVGDIGSGKTKLIERYLGKGYDEAYKPTTGVEFYKKVEELHDGTSVEMTIWDAQGEGLGWELSDSRNEETVAARFKNADGLIVAWDLTKPFDAVKILAWIECIAKHSNHQLQIAIVGTKSDINAANDIENDLQRFAKQCGYWSIMTSACEDVIFSINPLFNLLARQMIKNEIAERRAQTVVYLSGNAAMTREIYGVRGDGMDRLQTDIDYHSSDNDNDNNDNNPNNLNDVVTTTATAVTTTDEVVPTTHAAVANINDDFMSLDDSDGIFPLGAGYKL